MKRLGFVRRVAVEVAEATICTAAGGAFVLFALILRANWVI